jgi:hypothetical protein
LGVASEQAFLILLDTLTNALKNPKEKKKFEKIK